MLISRKKLKYIQFYLLSPLVDFIINLTYLISFLLLISILVIPLIALKFEAISSTTGLTGLDPSNHDFSLISNQILNKNIDLINKLGNTGYAMLGAARFVKLTNPACNFSSLRQSCSLSDSSCVLKYYSGIPKAADAKCSSVYSENFDFKRNQTSSFFLSEQRQIHGIIQYDLDNFGQAIDFDYSLANNNNEYNRVLKFLKDPNSKGKVNL